MNLTCLCVATLVTAFACYVLLPTQENTALRLRREGWIGHVEEGCSALGSVRVVARAAGTPQVQLVAETLQSKLRRLGIVLGQDECSVLVVAGILPAMVLGFVLSTSVAGCVALAGSYVVSIPLASATIERRRRLRLTQEMPTVFTTLASALGSGKTLAQSIEYVGLHEQGLLGEEFTRVALELRFGEPIRPALEGLARRLNAPGMGLLVSALIISQRTGSPLNAMLMSSAHMVEQQEELERTLSVKTAQVRLSVKIVCLMPLIMVSLLCLLSADFRQGLMTALGLGCVIVAILMDGLALVIVRHLMKGVL